MFTSTPESAQARRGNSRGAVTKYSQHSDKEQDSLAVHIAHYLERRFELQQNRLRHENLSRLVDE